MPDYLPFPISTFHYPTRIVFGPGASNRLTEELAFFGVTRPLLVTDRGLARSSLFERIAGLVRRQCSEVGLFDGVLPNPVEQNVLDGTAVYRDGRCNGIVGIGGGSALDVAKAITLKVHHPLPLADYDDLRDGALRITAQMPPFLAVPTTSGTGSDVSRSAVITLSATNRKTVVFSPFLMPKVSISDPELTLDLPFHLTAGTGMDAFTHCLEAFLSKGYHPMSDAIALRGVKLICEHLPRALADGHDLEARSQLMMAAIMGATAFQKGLGAVHSLAHPLSTIGGMHHGTSNAVMLPPVLRFNAQAVPDRYSELAAAMGVAPSIQSVIERVEELNRTCGFQNLRGYGITEAMIPAMATKAMEDGCRLCNPRDVTESDMVQLYREAL
ncbi:MAG: iron-containing alcohol dehydrogenase [Acidobacteriota bacterium]